MADQRLQAADGSFGIPEVGLGTWQSKPGEVKNAVKYAIEVGYRHIDCAAVYMNEDEIGSALQEVMNEGVVKREDLFICSKLWNTFHHPDDVKEACQKSLKDLQLDYLDLYLMHTPMGYQKGKGYFPVDDNGKTMYDNTDYVDTWQAMESLVDEGLCKAIGLSNVNTDQLERILAVTRTPVANVQNEINPYLTEDKLVEYCKSKDISLTAYSPFGSPVRPWANSGDPKLLEDSRLKAIAERYRKSVTQVLLQFQLQRGVAVIPKSVTPLRIKANFEIFDFKLSDEDMKSLAEFNINFRGGSAWRSDVDHPYYPFGKVN